MTNLGSMEDNGILREAFEQLNAIIISKWDLLCDDRNMTSCATKSPDGVPMTYDEHHLSYEFARYLGAKMKARGFDQIYTSNGRDPPPQ